MSLDPFAITDDESVAPTTNETPTLHKPMLTTSPAPIDLTALFMVIVGGLLVGTILQHPDPFYGANDASRWNTVYYLVEHGTYEFLPDHGRDWSRKKGALPEFIAPLPTIDMIRIVDDQGGDHYYSSKPPLLPSCLAGVVWLIEKLSFGSVDFQEHPFIVIRTTLIFVQVIPLLVCMWLLRQHLYRYSDSPFVRTFGLAVIAFGTYLTPWAVTLNNHVIAACTTLFALEAILRIWYDARREWYWFALAGFFAAFTAAIELPAGLLAVSLLVAMFAKDRRRTLTVAVPAALVPAIAGFVTNYLAVGSVLPAYLQVHKEGGWYDFPGSYWTDPRGIDALSDTKLVYLANILIGHHGFFLLTPVLALCLIGLVRQLCHKESPRRGLAAFTLLLTAAIVAVYTVKTNNYGGVTQGFRWLFWLIPMWLLFLPEGVQPFSQRRSAHVICYIALAVSMISVADALRKPWGDSWADRLFHALGWVSY